MHLLYIWGSEAPELSLYISRTEGRNKMTESEEWGSPLEKGGVVMWPCDLVSPHRSQTYVLQHKWKVNRGISGTLVCSPDWRLIVTWKPSRPKADRSSFVWRWFCFRSSVAWVSRQTQPVTQLWPPATPRVPLSPYLLAGTRLAGRFRFYSLSFIFHGGTSSFRLQSIL